MKTTIVETDVLRTLLKHVRLTCAQLGAELWQGGRGGGYRSINTRRYGNCSCPFARPAGSMVKRLIAKGLVVRVRVEKDHRTFYAATKKGERVYLSANGSKR